MSDQRPPWEPTDEDLADLPGFGAELLLRFDDAGALVWANEATQADMSSCAGTSDVGCGTGVAAVDARGLPVCDLARSPEAAACPPGSGTGPHVTLVQTATGPAWWEWRAWRDEAGHLSVAACDVTTTARSAREQWARQRTIDTLVDGAPAGIAVRSTDGHLVLANPRYREWFPDAGDVAPLTAAEAAVATTGMTTSADEEVATATGPRVLLTVRFPLRDPGGRVDHVATVATDITARIALERELTDRERVLDTLVRVSPDVVALVDAGGHLIEASDVLYALLGLPGPVPSHELALHLHPDDSDAVRRWLGGVLAGDDLGRCRCRLLRTDGAIVHLDTSGRRMVDASGAAVGAVLVARDVSASVDVQTRLQQAVAEAEEASRAKSAFLSRITRELRSPLLGVLGMADRLHRVGPGRPALTEAQREAVQHIERAGRHLQALVDEVLDVASVERRVADLQLEPVLVSALVAEAVALVRPLGERRQVRVVHGTDDGRAPDAAEGPWVWADRQRLLQVLLNLLSNGVKYNRPRGSVRVTVSAAGYRVRVAVADTGLGIAPEHLDRLFEPFDRLGAEHSGVEGTGVGLTLTKHLVEQMAGTVEVRSVVGTGSVFVVELAAAPAASVAPGGPPVAAQPLGRVVRVLHVEDDPASGELVRQLLDRRGGVELVRAADGATALALARCQRPDLVLLDLGLPDVGGEAVLAELRSDPTTAGIPVVVVSADATDGQVARLQAAGAAAYLTKPVAVGQLLALVDAAGGQAPVPR